MKSKFFELRSEKMEITKRKLDIRNWILDVRSWMLETRNWKVEVGYLKLEVRNWRLEIRRLRQKVRNWKLNFISPTIGLTSNFQTLIYLLVFVLGLPQISFTQVSPLDAYLLTAAHNNPRLKSKFANYQADLEKVPQVGVLPNLNISFGYFVAPIYTKQGPQQAKINVSQMFPWFGTLKSSQNVYTQQAKASYSQFEEAKSKLFFEIKSAYYDIYFINRGIAITHDNLSLLGTFQRVTYSQVETGKSSVLDAYRLEMEINELENDLAFLRDTKWALELNFHELINDSLNNEITVSDSLTVISLRYNKASLLDSLTVNNHVVVEMEMRLKSWEQQEIAAKKLGGPQITLGLDYAFIREASDPSSVSNSGQDAIMPFVGISIPLYRKKYSAMVTEAVYQMEAVSYEKQNTQSQLKMLFETSYRDYLDADRRINLYKNQEQLAKKSLRILMTSYATDGQDFVEVIRMQRLVLKYSLALDRARTDKNAAVAFVEYLLGN